MFVLIQLPPCHEQEILLDVVSDEAAVRRAYREVVAEFPAAAAFLAMEEVDASGRPVRRLAA